MVLCVFAPPDSTVFSMEADTTSGTLSLVLVSAGQDHTCGLTADRSAHCWGANQYGQLGIGVADEAAHPVPQIVRGGLKFKSLSVGANHTCALTDLGTAYCWGQNSFGQLGIGSLVSSATPVQVAGKLTFGSVDAGSTHTCGITMSGIAFCWGGNWHGQLGVGSFDGEERYPCCRTTPIPVAGQFAFSSVLAGGIHTCGLATDRKVYCWGNHKNFGQLGTGRSDLPDSPVPVPVSGGHGFVSLSVGMPSCGVAPDGTAYCWGGGAVPELGIEAGAAPFDRPVAVSNKITFKTTASGAFFACGIASDGLLYCWGYNRYGQIGNGSTEYADIPQRNSNELRFKLVTAGGNEFSGHACGITTDGRTFCWGDNRRGQLGNGTTVRSPRPVQVTHP